MNGFNSASENTHSRCLPPEAYLRIIKSCASEEMPKFMSTVYPSKKKAPAKKVGRPRKKS
jgi:hypothetical protein